MDEEKIQEMADLFWEQAGQHFNPMTDRHEAMAEAETLALDFLVQNPSLRKEVDLSPEELAQAIAERMP